MKNLILSLLVVGLAIGASAYKNAPEKKIDLKGKRVLPQGYLVQTSEGTYEFRTSEVTEGGNCLISGVANFCKYIVPANNNIPVQNSYTANTAASFNLMPLEPNRLWTE